MENAVIQETVEHMEDELNDLDKRILKLLTERNRLEKEVELLEDKAEKRGRIVKKARERGEQQTMEKAETQRKDTLQEVSEKRTKIGGIDAKIEQSRKDKELVEEELQNYVN